ncbi:MAG: hypothetical protein GXY67_07945 [Clostridiales bacterium]|nr:hypothetical protein [Clostridiales bacterium]
MTLKDRILADAHRVFMNPGHFAETHTWNGKEFDCVLDGEVAIKKKNANAIDLSWDNNVTETMIYTPLEGFPEPRTVQPNEHIFLDGKPMKILQVQEDGGMLGILVMSDEPKGWIE